MAKVREREVAGGARRGVGSLLVVGLLAGWAGCSSDDASSSSPGPAREPFAAPGGRDGAAVRDATRASADAYASLDQIRRHVVTAYGGQERARLRREGGLLRGAGEAPSFGASPDFAAGDPAAPRTADVVLPRRADGPVLLDDLASGMTVSFRLQEARQVGAVSVEGLAVFAAAGPSGADLVHRVRAVGTEDWLYFGRAPARETVRYSLDVRSVAGLRVVARTVELLDAGGAPRLRVAPPTLLGADGRRAAADLRVEGCAFDSSPRPPWGRPVTSPGAGECTLVIDWAGADVAYPALLDPAWVSTNNTMVEARTGHTVSELTPGAPSSILLLAGGFDDTAQALDSAELYEPLSRTFARAGSMNEARGAHTSTALTGPVLDGSPVAVLVAGGASSSGGTPVASLEIYDPVEGEFLLDGNTLARARYDHVAVLVDAQAEPAREVLLAGGYAPPLNQATSTAELYTFTEIASGIVSSSLASTGSMQNARAAASAVGLRSGAVLVTGGFVVAGNALDTAELYAPAQDPANGTFSNVTAQGGSSPATQSFMTVSRGRHTTTLLPEDPAEPTSSRILVVGGTNQATSGIFSDKVDVYYDTSSARGFAQQAAPMTLTAERARHTVTVLPNGSLVVAGGRDGSGAVADVDRGVESVNNPGTFVFTPLAASGALSPRYGHVAAIVNAGSSSSAGRALLLAGGTGPGGQPLDSAQLLLKPNGDPCTRAAECESGFCPPLDPDVDPQLYPNAARVCCDTACDTLCLACHAENKESGQDTGTCGPATDLRPLPNQCVDEIESISTCDGTGHVKVIQSIDCKPNTCASDGMHCSAGCTSDADCSEFGWCDTSGEGGGGGSRSGGSESRGGNGGGGSAPGGGGAGGATGGSGGDAGTAGTGGSGGDAGAAGSGGGGPTPDGVCRKRLGLGAPCTLESQCLDTPQESYCVDGFCCNLPCAGQCQACDVEGSLGYCTTVGSAQSPEQPHPNDVLGTARDACAGEGTFCGGVCDGASATECTYPAQGEIGGDAVCSCPDEGCVVGPATLTVAQCDGAGASTDESSSCNGFRCADATSCKDACSGDSDCIRDYICEGAVCVELTGPSCDGDHTVRVPAAEDIDCTPFTCDGTACRTTCQSVDDCVAPAVCNGEGQCVDQITAPEVASCSCSVPGRSTAAQSGRSHGRSGLAWLAVGLGAMVGLRRRQRRR